MSKYLANIIQENDMKEKAQSCECRLSIDEIVGYGYTDVGARVEFKEHLTMVIEELKALESQL